MSSAAGSTRQSLSRATKRTRTQKDLLVKKGAGDESSSDEEEAKEQKSTKAARTSRAKESSSSSSSRSKSRAAAPAATAAESASSDDGDDGDKTPEDLRCWVQCDRCGKWRALPATVDSSSLPDIWWCEMNTYDAEHNRCDQPEEGEKKKQPGEPGEPGLQMFFK